MMVFHFEYYWNIRRADSVKILFYASILGLGLLVSTKVLLQLTRSSKDVNTSNFSTSRYILESKDIICLICNPFFRRYNVYYFYSIQPLVPIENTSNGLWLNEGKFSQINIFLKYCFYFLFPLHQRRCLTNKYYNTLNKILPTKQKKPIKKDS